MLALEALNLAKIRLKNLSAIKDEGVFLSVLNLAISDLYRRFNLRLEMETVLVHTDLAVYELLNDDVSMLLALYDKMGKELKQSDVTDSMDYDVKIINYRQFTLRHLFDGYVYALYKANPVIIKDINDEIDLPNAMIPAMLAYISYMIENTTNVWDRGQVKSEPSFYWQIYEKECQILVNEGYLVPLNTESIGIQRKGFV